MTAALLDRTNAWMAAGGRGPGSAAVGECPAIIEATRINHWQLGPTAHVRLALTVWDDAFTDSDAVALFFARAGAIDVEISHVLHDQFNGTRQGKDVGGSRDWVVDVIFPPEHAAVIDLIPESVAALAGESAEREAGQS